MKDYGSKIAILKYLDHTNSFSLLERVNKSLLQANFILYILLIYELGTFLNEMMKIE